MANDKFIIMGIDDERSKDIADVIGNKTCKKIIDFLAETKEASEKDISQGLNIPLNTVEYNLKKLIKAGLVEKTKNFFWSIKGRKIEMYKLANKHIVISPKSARPSNIMLKSLVPFFAILLLLVLLALLSFTDKSVLIDQDSTKDFSSENVFAFRSFRTYVELNEYLKNQGSSLSSELKSFESSRGSLQGPFSDSAREQGFEASTAKDYSTTNIQVEGVDEADIVKTDGKNIYVVTTSGVAIAESYPAEHMRLLSFIEINNVLEIYVTDNKLVIIINSFESNNCKEYRYNICSTGTTKVLVYDITDKIKPALKTNYTFDGVYYSSRLIDNYVYIISTKSINYPDPIIPFYEVNGVRKTLMPEEIYYPPYTGNNHLFTIVNSIDTSSTRSDSSAFLTGPDNKIYMSKKNLYISYIRDHKDSINQALINEVYLKIVDEKTKKKIEDLWNSNDPVNLRINNIRKAIYEYSESLSGIKKQEFDSLLLSSLEEFYNNYKNEKTTAIQKIELNEIDFKLVASGYVPGTVLNQFSMDEHDDYFRLATTTGNSFDDTSQNNIYVLDNGLKIIGSLEGLAPGEKIYSARFTENRAFLVTFKDVDPFFVIDLKTPEKPAVLGYLKIPGYSDYLHPYDDNNIIGIGKEVHVPDQLNSRSLSNNFLFYQGLKISFFDVTDVENPVEKDRYIIGDRGTESPVLKNHKSLLYSLDKDILVIPVTVAEINKQKYMNCPDNKKMDNKACISPGTFGETVFQGAYVFNVRDNLKLVGKITHHEDKVIDSTLMIRRSLYIHDILYTISEKRIMANNLNDLKQVNLIEILSSKKEVIG